MASWRRLLTTLIVAVFLVGYGPVSVSAGVAATGPDPGSPSAGAIDGAAITDSDGAVDPFQLLGDIPGVEDDGGNATDDPVDDAEETTDDAEEDAEETTDDATEQADETVEETAEDTAETTGGTVGEVDDTAETTDGMPEATERTNGPEGQDATGTVGSTVEAETSGIEQEVTDVADGLDADVGDATTAVTDAEDGSVGSVTDQVANTVGELDRVTAGTDVSMQSFLERTTVIDQSVETTASVDVFDPTDETTSGGSTVAGSDAGGRLPTATMAPDASKYEAVSSTDMTDSTGDSEAIDGDKTDGGETDGDETDDGGVPLPDSRTGSGIAAGTVLIGAALIARSTGTAAALSALSGSGGSLLATLISVLRDWVGRFLSIFGYKRYSDDDPLAHETRERLYELIRDAPGSYLAEISDETGVTMGTARYHLRVLEFENLVASEEIRGRRRYVPVGTDWAALEAALHDETTARIVEALERGGPDSVSGLADRLDRDPSTISHHLDRLADDGIVERERDGRAVVNKLADDARISLEGDETAPGRAPVSSGAD
jgi:DNA-binding transcriptional ArsR family regulator